MRLAPAVLLVLSACSDYGLFGNRGTPEDPGPRPEPEDPDTAADTDPDPEPDGACDGVEAEAGHDVPFADRCVPGFTPPADPGDLVVTWHWTGLSTNPNADSVWTTPVVANLTDDNGDGAIDELDTPDVAFTTCEWIVEPTSGWGSCPSSGPVMSFAGSLVILDGATGAPLLEKDGFDIFGQVTAADVDGDGLPEVIAYDTERFLVGIQADGTETWRSKTRAGDAPWTQCVNVADLEGDGVNEVVTQWIVWDGATGAAESWTYDFDAQMSQARGCPVADIDLDGVQEWFPGAKVSDPDANVELALATDLGNSTEDSQHVLPVQADADPEGEIAFVGASRFQVFDTDGTELADVVLDTREFGTAGPPCAGDFDGDGAMEVGVPWSDTLYLLELDGSVKWKLPIRDASGHSGCSGFDADGDGALELFFADQEDAYMLDGATGAEIWRSDERNSGTGADYPVVADADADGSADLLLTGNDDLGQFGWNGVVLLSHATAGWAPGGPVWTNHDYVVTNVLPDGSIPAHPEPSWQGDGVYRARPAMDGAAGLSVAVTDECVPGCEADDVVYLAVTVTNAGLEDATVPVTLYALHGDGRTALDTREVSVAKGRASDSLLYEVPRSELGDGLVVVADDDGTGVSTVEECEETDNSATWIDPGCD
jgi:hypothetical protein